MTRRTPHFASKAQVVLECEWCHAGPGEWCKRPNGEVSPWTHQARVRALLELERTGPL